MRRAPPASTVGGLSSEEGRCQGGLARPELGMRARPSPSAPGQGAAAHCTLTFVRPVQFMRCFLHPVIPALEEMCPDAPGEASGWSKAPGQVRVGLEPCTLASR